MNTHRAGQATALAAFSLIFLLTFTTGAQAALQKGGLGALLKKSGMTMKLERLNRADGFPLGLSFQRKNMPAVTIAPGLDRMLLVRTGAGETIFQGDGSGGMQIIQSDGDFAEALCVLNAVIQFISGLQTCQGDFACLFTEIFTLVTNLQACDGSEPEPEY